MQDNASRLKKRLKSIGLSDSAIVAAWPTWWSDAAEASASAQTELRFSLARKLGLDPHSLLKDNEEPRFIWRDEARFKHLRDESPIERSAITSFGTALGRYLIEATAGGPSTVGWDALRLRGAILATQPYIRLVALLSVCWGFGIPVVHLRIFPCTRKRMSAMTVRIGDRIAILVGKDSMYPPHIAFYLAHELAHIALGHLSEEPILVDLEDGNVRGANDDPEEIDADRFALELLTGTSQPTVLPRFERYSSKELARIALDSAPDLAIEPGTLALCFGFSTRDWATANAAMQSIYESPKPVWSEINRLALNQLNFSMIPDDARSYLHTILGDPQS